MRYAVRTLIELGDGDDRQFENAFRQCRRLAQFHQHRHQMMQSGRYMRKHRSLVAERAIPPGEPLVDRGETGWQLARRDIADARHGHESPVKRRWASACAIAGANLSNRPVARSSSATCRVTDIAISATALAVLARTTPSASSSATFGDPARILMLIGAPRAFTSRPIVAGSRNPIG